MKEKIKITSHQLGSLVAIHTCGTTIIVVSASLASLAKQDAWISALAAIVIGLSFVWMYGYLGSLYPNMTYIEIIKAVLGKWIGQIVAINFVFLSFVVVPQVVYYLFAFISMQYLPETPPYVISFIYVLTLCIAMLYGLEAIVRSAEIFIYGISALFILTMLLVSPNININNLFPILEKGIVPVSRGTLYLSAFITWPLINLMMVYPKNIININEARKSIFIGYLWGALLTFISVIMSILVLGSTIASQTAYPTYLLAKEVNVGTILTRFEAIVVAVWIVSLFYRGLMYFYILVIGSSQLIGLKDYRKIVIPYGLIVLVLSNVIYRDTMQKEAYLSTTWVLYSMTFSVVLPVVLLLVTAFKRSIAREKENKEQFYDDSDG